MINVSDFKDKAIFFAWIAGLIILIALLWIFTQPLQAHYLMQSVNKVFIYSGEPYRLTGNITWVSSRQTAQNKGRNTELLGYWYSLDSTIELGKSSSILFVFNVFRDGILVPLGAIVSSDCKVEKIIPLSIHAENTYNNLPDNIIKMYVTRIETAAANLPEGR
jgi:hypothetical protein